MAQVLLFCPVQFIAKMLKICRMAYSSVSSFNVIGFTTVSKFTETALIHTLSSTITRVESEAS